MAKKKMLAFSPERSAALEEKLREWNFRFEKKKMFGHETFFHNGYMFTGANVDGIFVHLGRRNVEQALSEEKGLSPFSPMEGMVMRDYVLLREEILNDEYSLETWVKRSYEYLAALKPKIKK